MIICLIFFFSKNKEISLPNEQGRLDIIKIHAAPIAKRGDIGKIITIIIILFFLKLNLKF